MLISRITIFIANLGMVFGTEPLRIPLNIYTTVEWSRFLFIGRVINFFNSCDIREGEKEFLATNFHDHLSDSIDLKLRLKSGKEAYIMAYFDGDIQVSDWEGESYYYIHNSALQDYIINTMGKYLNPSTN